MDILIKNAHVIDPANKINEESDILIEKGKISKVAKNIKTTSAKVIDAKGKIAAPGLFDMHAHLRQPGREDEETVFSASKSAAKGGITSVCAMPNTDPVCDNRGQVEFVFSEARKAGLVNVYPIAAITKGLKGDVLSEIGDLKDAGAVAISDDGKPVINAEVLRRALEYAKMLDVVLISHCEDLNLSGNGVMNEGLTSTLLGFKPIPKAAESTAVQRDLQLAKLTGSKIHIAHVSCEESIKAIKLAKKEGVSVTAETCPHYFALTDEAVKNFDTSTKVNPPLRTKKDVEAIKKALAEGVIDVITTDHAPHSEAEKDVEFQLAPSGMIGFETTLSLGIKELVQTKILPIEKLIEKMSLNPAKILGINAGTLSVGSQADILIFDPDSKWTVKRDKIVSMSKNSPFIGWELPGVVIATICHGKVIYQRGGTNDG